MTLSAKAAVLALPSVTFCAVSALLALASSVISLIAPLLGPQKPNSDKPETSNDGGGNKIDPREDALEVLVFKAAASWGRFLDEATPFYVADAPCFEPVFAWLRSLKG
jgi:hypothetical protein